MTNSRLQYFDVIKGIAIFLVVMGHVLTMCIRDIDQAFLFKMIGEIHMPLFFFISGFFTYKAAENRSFLSPKIKRRFFQLIIPFFVVGTLWIFYFPHSGLQSPLKPGFNGFYFDIWKNGYWFTLCLFEIILIYSAISKLLASTNSLFAHISISIMSWIIIGIFAFVILPSDYANLFGLPLVFQFYLIFMAGLFARRYQNQFLNSISSSKIYTPALLLTIVVLYLTCYSWEFSWLNRMNLYFIRVILHITLAIVVINIVNNYTHSTNNFAVKTFTYIGKESLAIYLLHYFFLFPMTFLQEPLRAMNLNIVPTLIISAIAASAVIAITLIVNYIIGRSKTLALLLTGKI